MYFEQNEDYKPFDDWNYIHDVPNREIDPAEIWEDELERQEYDDWKDEYEFRHSRRARYGDNLE